MKQCKVVLIFSLLLCSLVPGCKRYIEWGERSFYQGEQWEHELTHARNYIRSVKMYDQLSTLGIFDVMWLSDDVRTVYADLESSRRGKTNERKEVFLRRQLEENDYFISFYLLSAPAKKSGFAHAGEQGYWSLFLTLGDEVYYPSEIKKVDLAPEYELMFGKRANRFKTAYLVKFNARSLDDEDIFRPDVHTLELHINGVDRGAALQWHFNDDGDMILTKNDVVRT